MFNQRSFLRVGVPCFVVFFLAEWFTETLNLRPHLFGAGAVATGVLGSILGGTFANSSERHWLARVAGFGLVFLVAGWSTKGVTGGILFLVAALVVAVVSSSYVDAAEDRNPTRIG